MHNNPRHVSITNNVLGKMRKLFRANHIARYCQPRSTRDNTHPHLLFIRQNSSSSTQTGSEKPSFNKNIQSIVESRKIRKRARIISKDLIPAGIRSHGKNGRRKLRTKGMRDQPFTKKTMKRLLHNILYDNVLDANILYDYDILNLHPAQGRVAKWINKYDKNIQIIGCDHRLQVRKIFHENLPNTIVVNGSPIKIPLPNSMYSNETLSQRRTFSNHFKISFNLPTTCIM